MEVNPGFPTSISKRMNMGVTTTLAPIIDSSGVSQGAMTSVAGPHQSAIYEPFQQHILQLKEQQRLQEQLLLQQFNAQRQHLAEQYEQQLQSLKAYMERQNAVAQQQQQQQQQQQMEQEEAARQERDAEKLEALKNKDKSAQSAVASSEVKQRLQEFVLNKKQREAAAASASTSGSGASTCSGSPPIRNWHTSLLKKYEEDYPLRKTASEPNLKVRLKQRVSIERRSSPLRRRKDRHHIVKRRSQLAIDSTSAGSTPDSGPSSPPSMVGGPGGGAANSAGQMQPGSSAATIQEEVTPAGSPYNPLANANMQLGSVGDLTASLYSSPSMPNISLGRPPSASSSMDGPKLPTLSEAEMKMRLGIPPGSTAMIPGAFHPLYTLQDESGAGAFTSPAIHQMKQHLTALEQAGQLYPHMYPPAGPITDAQVAHARLSKTNPGRPLNRTQSAPLPLGHPMLQGPPGSATAAAAAAAAAAAVFMQQQQQHQHQHPNSAHLPPGFPAPGPGMGHHPAAAQLQLEQYMRDRQLLFEQAQHSLMKQQLRATVLTRAGSKNHVENVEEETEAAIAQEMAVSPDKDSEVIDLTGGGGGGGGGGCGKSKAAAYRESVHRSESSSRESDATPDEQQQQLQMAAACRLASAKSDLERHVLSRRAARGDQAAMQQLQQLQHQHQHQQQQRLLASTSTDLINSGRSPFSATAPEALPGATPGSSSSSSLSPLRSHHHIIRPLSRALSSPLVTLGGPAGPGAGTNASGGVGSRATVSGSSSPVLQPRAAQQQQYPVLGTGQQRAHPPGHLTALAYDSLMLKHQCSCGDNSSHPEHSGRLQSIWARLQETGLAGRCEKIRSRKASLEEIQACHAETHTLLFGTSPLHRQRLDWNRVINSEGGQALKNFVVLQCRGLGVDSDTTWDELHTAAAARMAVGCVMDLAFKVAQGEASNGFAIVRPPGHHAEQSQAMGFCFFNNVAIAAKHLRYQLGLEKIMILDWDVHHGNGTQQLFYDDCHVLYLSIHRHDLGNFFPGTGGSIECGVHDGNGFTVNVAWSGSLSPPMGDAEYLAAFRTIVLPILQDFHPDIILVSCGFDAARGHPAPLGGYDVSPACFAHMTRSLMQFAHGKVVLALEGGYTLSSICDCSEQCLRALLGDQLPPIDDDELRRKPCQEAIDTLQKTIAIQASHWPVIKRWAHLVNMSAVEAATHPLPGASIGVDRGPEMPPPPSSSDASSSSQQQQSSNSNGNGNGGPGREGAGLSTLVSHKRSLFGHKSDSTEESETVNAMASLSVHHPHMSPPPTQQQHQQHQGRGGATPSSSTIVKSERNDEPMDEDPVKE